jgi:hypothetical protein
MARELIDESSYGPETLKILYQAFDDAWEALAPMYAGDPEDRIVSTASRLPE